MTLRIHTLLLCVLVLAACDSDPGTDVFTDMGSNSDLGSTDAATDLGVVADSGFDLGVIADSGTDSGPGVDSGTDAGPVVDAAVDAGPGPDASMCEPAALDEGLYAGVGCDHGEEICPSDYECFSFSGIVAGPPHCEIPCADSCECPTDFSCQEVSDKSGTHHFCRLQGEACMPIPGDGGANVGTSCTSDSSVCGDGYECSEYITVGGSIHTCEIKCRADCECPDGYTCDLREDAVSAHRYCRSAPISGPVEPAEF